MSRLINGLDIETTGLDQEAGDRIIEVAILTFDLDARTMVDRYVQRINPERSISAKAQEVHGISYTDLIGSPKWEDVAATVQRQLAKAPYVVIHNAGFDAPFVAGELLRVGLPVPDSTAICTMENGRWATFDGKSPKLMELCFSLGVPYDPTLAHAAEYDVLKMMECFFAGLDRGFYQLPE